MIRLPFYRPNDAARALLYGGASMYLPSICEAIW